MCSLCTAHHLRCEARHLLQNVFSIECVLYAPLIIFAVRLATCYSVKRDLLQCQKRPIKVSKETSYSVSAHLRCQTRHLFRVQGFKV